MTSTCLKCGAPYPDGAWPICQDSTGRHGHYLPHGGSLLTAIHSSDRPVVYRNPRTGEVRSATRRDEPMPENLARAGYVRSELETPQAIRQYEKQTGRLHERSHYDPGQPTLEREMAPPDVDSARSRVKEETKRKLVEAVSALS